MLTAALALKAFSKTAMVERESPLFCSIKDLHIQNWAIDLTTISNPFSISSKFLAASEKFNSF